jgi:hypothetical protein
MESDDGSIPNLISLSQIPVNYLQQIETDLLEPQVFNQGGITTDGFCRFTLDRKGFLHSHSKLFLSVESASTGVSDGYFNPVTGIGQVIKKAVLKIGNKTLNEVTSWDALFSAKSSLIKGENNMEREFYTTGRFANFDFKYNTGSDVLADKIALETGYEYSENDAIVPTWAKIDGNNVDQSPTFSIDLSDLFPFLKVNQLPLYMISEPVVIELTFYPTQGKRIQVESSDDTGTQANIRRSDIKFCADYVFYTQGDMMERFANANKNMTFSFVDYRGIELTTTQATLGSGIIRNLGMANRVVPRVITTVVDSTQGETDILPGTANALSPALTAGVPGTIAYNIRYNDRYEFTSDVDNTARLFSILTDSEGVPFLSRARYSHQKDTITTDTLQGRAQNTGFGGKSFFMGTKLTNGRVGQRGLELHLTGAFPAATDLVRSFCEYMRVARLSDGYFDVFNA